MCLIVECGLFGSNASSLEADLWFVVMEIDVIAIEFREIRFSRVNRKFVGHMSGLIVGQCCKLVGSVVIGVTLALSSRVERCNCLVLYREDKRC